MIYSPKNIEYYSAIETAINSFNGYQISLSISFPHSKFCMYDRILAINSLLQKVYSNYRQINRRANIESFLVVMSEKSDLTCLCTILVKHTGQLLENTVQSRIVMISELVLEAGIDANVFYPLGLAGSDFNRYHQKNITGAFSINTLNPNEQLQLRDCVEF